MADYGGLVGARIIPFWRSQKRGQTKQLQSSRGSEIEKYYLYAGEESWTFTMFGESNHGGCCGNQDELSNSRTITNFP